MVLAGLGGEKLRSVADAGVAHGGEVLQQVLQRIVLLQQTNGGLFADSWNPDEVTGSVAGQGLQIHRPLRADPLTSFNEEKFRAHKSLSSKKIG